MQLHHSKHHATYVNNLNVAEEKYKEALAKGLYIHSQQMRRKLVDIDDIGENKWIVLLSRGNSRLLKVF